MHYEGDMFNSINFDAAAKHVKQIVDSSRCAVCDKAGGTRMRYPCGHTSCDDCVVVAPDCLVCLTPQNSSNEPTSDKPFTERAENALNLLNVFQKEFHVDVHKRQRLSEQLKVEKELFPECIQAPAKYFNKRKSYRDPNSKKENRLSQFSWEQTSIWDHKMDQPGENVEKWLNKYLRKPFADLNSNDERLRKVSSAFMKQQNVTNTENESSTFGSTRKRSHFKTALSVVKNQALLDSQITSVKKKKNREPRASNNLSVKSKNSKYFKTGSNIKMTGNDESGVVMDDEPVVIINDSQSLNVDKDMKAWLAVQEAENNKQYDSMSIITSKSKAVSPQTQDKEKHDTLLTTNVPFYLKSSLSRQCNDCNERNDDEPEMAKSNDDKSYSNAKEPTKEVSVIVESECYTTIIKVKSTDNVRNKVKSMHSIEIQTDIISSENYNKEIGDKLDHGNELVKKMSQIIACKLPSQDLFQEDVNTDSVKNILNEEISKKSINTIQNIVIEESDSDEDLDASVSMEVTAEIHRSCEKIDYGILADIDNIEEHSKRARRAARGFTPTSTDSSNKENFNPNRKKKVPSSKKKPIKK